MTAYYNEIDAEAAAALRQLVRAGVVAPGEVDERSIKEVSPDDLKDFTQCHFFAGAGLWSFAARLARWPDERQIWTGSCPCQPFSAAGKQLGTDDPRHLWPDFYRLIRGRRPAVVVGEQVAGAIGYGWFDGVRADLAREEIPCRVVDIPACAIDAPHQRNRLYWVALANTQGDERGAGLRQDGTERHGIVSANRDGGNELLANAESISSGRDFQERRPQGRAADRRLDAASPVGDAEREGLEGQRGHGDDGAGWSQSPGSTSSADGRNGSWWSDAEWITCHDGKARRAKPDVPMLVDGMVGRNGLWRIAGNSIVPQIASEVIASILEIESDLIVAA